MQKFKYYGSTKITNAKATVTIILFLLLTLVIFKFNLKKTVYLGISDNVYLQILFANLIANFLVSKIVKKFDFKSLAINLDDEVLNLPKKYYWSKKCTVSIALKNIRYILNQNLFLNKGIYIDFEDSDGNFSSLLLEGDLFESKKSMTDFLNSFTQRLGFSLVPEGHFYYSKNKEIYAKL